MEKETKSMNLYDKIQAVSDMVRNVEKNIVVGRGQSAYKAVSDLDVLMKVKDAEKEYSLVSIPVKQELVKSEIVRTIGEGGYEKLVYADIVKMTVRIVNVDKPEEYIEVESFGRGLDTGDKGFGKASTYARKYALLNAYKIATGEDPDQNKSVEQVALSQDEVRTKIVDYLMKNAPYANSILSFYGLTSIDDLESKHIKAIYKNLTAKGIQL